MDYRELLKKFMKSISETEGVSFEYFISVWTGVNFSNEEVEELTRLEKEYEEES